MVNNIVMSFFDLALGKDSETLLALSYTFSEISVPRSNI